MWSRRRRRARRGRRFAVPSPRIELWWWSRPSGLAHVRVLAVTITGAIGAAAGFGAALGLSGELRVALALLAFLGGLWVLIVTWREQRLPDTWLRAYLGKAAEQPAELFGLGRADAITGRDDLCGLILGDLRDRGMRDRTARRPYVLVGPEGAGKTAVLIRLAQLLAGHKIVAVPLSMRDGGLAASLDLLEGARARFIDIFAGSAQLVETEADAGWRRLRDSNRLVVLVDDVDYLLDGVDDGGGGDELVRLLGRALSLARGQAGVAEGISSALEREDVLKVAVERLQRQNVPVVLASRRALTGLNATAVAVDALSDTAALHYLTRRGDPGDARLEHLFELADLGSVPFYLGIARALQGADLLNRVDLRGADRSTARTRLTEAWFQALVDGRVAPWSTSRVTIALNREQRLATLLQLGALACCGMAHDRQDVFFSDFEDAPESAGDAATTRYRSLAAELQRRLDGLAGAEGRIPIDLRTAADDGVQLGIVEPRHEGVRFRNGTMQAHLGVWLLAAALDDSAFAEAAWSDPGRTLLQALAALSRFGEGTRAETAGAARRNAALRDKLMAAADRLPPPRRLAVVATAVEVGVADGSLDHEGPARAMADLWSSGVATTAAEATRLEAVTNLGRLAAQFSWASADPDRGEAMHDAARAVYSCLYEIAHHEPVYAVRSAAADEIARGADAAFEAIADQLASHDSEREQTVRAWIIPMLAASVSRPANRDDAREMLRRWTRDRDGLSLAFEAALAHGFKRAANCGMGHLRDHSAPMVANEAAALLRSSRFWFSRVNLVQALSLWQLWDSVYTSHVPGRAEEDPRLIVARWLRREPGSPDEHPFVLAAADLAVEALRTGRPDRFMWMDEGAFVSRAGSRSTESNWSPSPSSWIPASSGWLQLDPRAQQLLADILIMLNLARRGGTAAERERYLHRTTYQWPYCLSGERRRHLEPLTIGVAELPPGANCAEGCPAELCPYPPKQRHADQVELSAAFCRHQRALVSRWRRRAPWQSAPRAELRAFWSEMEERARI